MMSMSPAVMSSPQTYNNLSYNFSPSMGIVIVVVIAVLLFLGFFSIYVRRCARAGSAGESDAGPTAVGRPLRTHESSLTDKGLDRSVVESLPVVHFKDLKNLEKESKNKNSKTRLEGDQAADDAEDAEHAAAASDDDDDAESEHRECAVCLSDFEEDDDLRLLPGCKHVFHQDCIDVWFQSHSTCPLCRASLVPKLGDDGKLQHVHAAGEYHRGLQHEEAHSAAVAAEEQESSEAPGDSRALAAAGSHEVVVAIHGDDEDGSALKGLSSSAGSGRNHEVGGAWISRDDQRDSAQLALFRNSRSFKKAARGVVAHERATTTSSMSEPQGPAARLETRTSLTKSWKLLQAAPTDNIQPMRRSSSLDNNHNDGSSKCNNNNNNNMAKSENFFKNENYSPKLESQHSLPAAMKLATINVPTTTTSSSSSSSDLRASRRTTGSYSGIEFLRTESIGSTVEKARAIPRSNSEHWVSIELGARPASSSALKTNAVVARESNKDLTDPGRSTRKLNGGGDQSFGRSERWNFLNLRNLLSS